MGLDIRIELEMAKYYRYDNTVDEFYPMLVAPANWRGSKAHGWEAIYTIVGSREKVDCVGERELEVQKDILECLGILARGQWMGAAAMEALVATAPPDYKFRLKLEWF